MTDCTHRLVQAWNDAETREPIDFWSCQDCGHRFEPLQIRKPLPLDRIFAAADRADDVIVTDQAASWTEVFAREIESEHGITTFYAPENKA